MDGLNIHVVIFRVRRVTIMQKITYAMKVQIKPVSAGDNMIPCSIPRLSILLHLETLVVSKFILPNRGY